MAKKSQKLSYTIENQFYPNLKGTYRGEMEIQKYTWMAFYFKNSFY